MDTTARRAPIAPLMLAAALALAATAASAQKVYRIVGPDGKVTFSDHPPGEGQNAAVIREAAPAARPASAPAPEAATTDPAPNRGGAKRAQRPYLDPVRPNAAPAVNKEDEALVKAVVRVLTYRTVIERFEPLCSGALADQAGKVRSAASGWRNRNGSMVARADMVLGDTLASAQRSEVMNLAETGAREILSEAQNAPAASRARWCEQSVGEINSGQMDIARDTRVSAPLLAYTKTR